MSDAPISITTTELATRTGVSRFQLMRWAEAGLIPDPTRRPGPQGRGRQGVWPAGVENRVRRIQALSGRGVPLFMIADELRRDDSVSEQQHVEGLDSFIQEWWCSPGASDQLSQDVKRLHGLAASATPFEHFRCGVQRLLTAHGITMSPDVFASDPETWLALLKRALSLLMDGFAPVAVLNGDRIMVNADVLVPFLQRSDADYTALVSGIDWIRTSVAKTIVNTGVCLISISLRPLLIALWPARERDRMPDVEMKPARVIWREVLRDREVVEQDFTLLTTPEGVDLQANPWAGRVVDPYVSKEGEAVDRLIREQPTPKSVKPTPPRTTRKPKQVKRPARARKVRRG